MIRRWVVLVAGIFYTLISSSVAQVHIKARVEIKPLLKSANAAMASSDLDCFSGSIDTNGTYQGVRVLRSCQVTMTGTFNGPGTFMGILVGQYANISNSSITFATSCGAGVGFELYSFSGCGIVVTSVTGSVSGNSANYNIDGYQECPSWSGATGTKSYFTAGVTISAAPSSDGNLGGISIAPENGGDLNIACGGSMALAIHPVAVNGNPFCYGNTLWATASINAKGPYVYLVSGSDTGTAVSVPLINGAFSVVLDSYKGLIPAGGDTATITINALGITSSATVYLHCDYQSPTVHITYPDNDTTVFTISPSNKPTICLSETHTPTDGLEPKITWSPSSQIVTSDFFDAMTNDTTIQILVTATNPVGTASDHRTIKIKKAGEFDHFVLHATPDSIEYNSFTVISGTAVDKDGNETYLDQWTSISVSASPDNIGDVGAYSYSGGYGNFTYSDLLNGDILSVCRSNGAGKYSKCDNHRFRGK